MRTLRLLAACLLFAPSIALSQDVEEEGRRPARERTAQEKAREAAKEAAELRPTEGEDVTYEQVLAKPDDIDLNYRFALGQVRRGEVRGAAATLERVLMVKPSFVQARLVYAIVLFRLDNLTAAQKEFEDLLKLTLPDDIRQEVDSYLKQIAGRKRKTHIEASLSAGFGYQLNRNAAPTSSSRLFADNVVRLDENSRRQDDTDILAAAGFRISRDLPSQAGHQVFGGFNYVRDEQTRINSLDLQAYSLHTGFLYKTPFADITPTASFDHVLLSQQSFLRQRGGAVAFERRFSKRLDAGLQAGSVYQDYVPTREVPTAVERTGNVVDVTVGAGYVLGPTTRLNAALTHEVKNAVRRYNAYDRESIALTFIRLLGKGRFLLSSLTLNFDGYEANDPAISRKTRNDITTRLRATYGLPLGFIAKPLKAVLFTPTYEYYHADSNITNYIYDDHKVSGLFTYRWEY